MRDEETKRAEEALRILIGEDLYREIEKVEKTRKRKGIKATEPITSEELEVSKKISVRLLEEFEGVLDKARALEDLLANVRELTTMGYTVGKALKMMKENGVEKEPFAGETLFDWIKHANKVHALKSAQ